jgi:hypothetical protein
MGDKRLSTIERIVHRIEEHIEEWRERDKALKEEAEANRDALWAEAAERERLLAEAIGQETGRGSAEVLAEQERVVFVMHTEEVSRALETFAREGDRLVRVVPGTGRGSHVAAPGVKGTWLVFETSE